MRPELHVGIFGAGAIGGYVGARLRRAGTRVTLLARPSVAEELRAHGATISDFRGFSASVSALPVATEVEALRETSHVLVTTKSGDTESAARALERVIGEDTTVVSFQNGVQNPEVLRAALPGRTVLAAMVPFNVVRRDGGVFHQGTSGKLAIEAHPRAEPLALALVRAGLPAALDPHVEQKQWGKLLVNLGNAVNALSGVPIRTMLQSRGYRRVMAAVFGEGERTLRRATIEPVLDMPVPARLVPRILTLPDALFRLLLPVLAKVDAEARSSMADDLLRGRKTEVDVLNGEIVRLAERAGARAPINERIVTLVHAAENGAPPLTASALGRALELHDA